MNTDDNQLFDPSRFGQQVEQVVGPGLEEGDRAVRVLPDVSGISREFDYRCPARWAAEIAIGSLVRIDLNGRRVAGWVTAVDVDPPENVLLAPIRKLSSIGPPPEIVDLVRWACRRWHGRLAPVLTAASPPRMISARPSVRAGPTPSAGAVAASVKCNENDADWMSRAVLESAQPGAVLLLQSSPISQIGPMISTLAAQGNTLVIEPDVARAQWLAGRLARSPALVGVRVHAHPQQWADGFTGGVVVGSRSVVWAPLPDLRSVVVINEHDESLQEERVPTWHSRDVAIERARRAGAGCVLVSPVPSLAALDIADAVVAGPRAEIRNGWPVVDVVDRRDDELGFTSLFSTRLVEVLRDAERAVLILNRKGRARLLACITCGELARSEDGHHLMIEDDGGLLAPATGERRPLVCAVCVGTTLKRLRLGIGKAAEDLGRLLDRPVVEFSSDRRSVEGSSRLILGTEAALRAVDRCDVVAFLDLDQELLAARYRAGEQAMSLLGRAARLVGGRRAESRLLLQTRMPEHPVVRAAASADPSIFSAVERISRRALGWPPFGALAEISGPGAEKMAAELTAVALSGSDTQTQATVLGPRHDGRFLLSVQVPESGYESTDVADNRLAEILAATKRPKERVRVVVDPPRV